MNDIVEQTNLVLFYLALNLSVDLINLETIHRQSDEVFGFIDFNNEVSGLDLKQ